MIYQVTIVLFLIWSQFMVALEYFFDVKVIRVCFVGGSYYVDQVAGLGSV